MPDNINPNDEAAKKAVDEKALVAKVAADEAEKNKDKNKNDVEEEITIKKSDWEKTNADLENYRTGLINKKKNERDLGGNNEVVPVVANSTLDEKKVQEIAIKASMASIHKRNEKAAISQFLRKNPDYVDDKQWKELIPFLPANINKDEESTIVDAIEGAVLLHKRATGKLDEYLAIQKETAKKEAEMNAQVNLGRGAGGIGQKSNQNDQANKIPESTVIMGQKFGHDQAKIEKTLKEIGKNDEGAFEINVMAPKK